jgi:hypothetical protein
MVSGFPVLVVSVELTLPGQNNNELVEFLFIL